MEYKWIKIVTDIFDDEKILLIETLPEADSIIVIWFKLLCLAGKQNNSGVFMLNDKIPYTDKMFSVIFRRKEAVVQLALSTFEEFGMVEIIDDAITIPNWGKYQGSDKLEQRKEYMRTYMSEYRQKQKKITEQCGILRIEGECKVNSKANSKVNVNPLDKSKSKNEIRIDNTCGEKSSENAPKKTKAPVDDTLFELFWRTYPTRDGKKPGKKKAREAWHKIKPDAELAEIIIKAVEAAKQTTEWKKERGIYAPHASTWLNGARWEDEYTSDIDKDYSDGKDADGYNF